MTTFTESASKAEEIIDAEVGYEMGSAHLYSVNIDLNGEVSLTLATAERDVYELLDSDTAVKVAQVSDYIALVTTGWAAPLNSEGEAEGAPSQHPAKRRVRLSVFASRQSVVSVLRFQDEPNEPVVDEGQATGSLADAVQNLLVRAF
jgi:hypothetical protein